MERGDVVQDCNGELWVVDEAPARLRGVQHHDGEPKVVYKAFVDRILVVRYDCSHEGLVCQCVSQEMVTKVGHTENIPDLRNC